MKTFPTYQKMRIASSHHSKHNLSHNYYTTSDFFKLKPFCPIECVSKDKFNLNVNFFCRMSPLSLPTFSKIHHHLRGFFVPSYTIMEGYNEFKSEDFYILPDGTKATLSHVPLLNHLDLCLAFGSNASYDPDTGAVTINDPVEEGVMLDNELATCVKIVQHNPAAGILDSGLTSSDYPTVAWDYVMSWVPSVLLDSQLVRNNYSGNYVFFKLTDKGRRLYDFLRSFRFNLNFIFAQKTDRPDNSMISRVPTASNWTNEDLYETYTAMPLLAFLRVYLDYYYPSLYYDEQIISHFFKLRYRKIRSSTPQTVYSQDLTVNDFAAIADSLYATYNKDYFSTAWRTPVSPNDLDYTTDIKFPDVSQISTALHSADSSSSNDDTPVVTNSIGFNKTPVVGVQGSQGVVPDGVPRLSQYALNALRSLTNFMNRNRMVGYRPLERFLARYGVRLPDTLLNRSEFLGSSDSVLKVTDIMSNASTDSATVGDYAGAGAGFDNNFHIKKNVQYDGFIILVSTLIPEQSYIQGTDRMWHHKSVFDFWTPEFDGLGVQGLRFDELFSQSGLRYPFQNNHYNFVNNYRYSSSVNSAPNAIWGYTPRYAEYKVMQDVVSGDFAVPSLNTNLLPFIFFRNVCPTAGSAVMPLSKSFMIGRDYAQYDNIFQVNNPELDHFYFTFDISIKASRPMLSLADGIDISDGGKEIKIPFGGIQIN